MKYCLGRYVFGFAAIGSGLCALVWHDFSTLAGVPHPRVVVYIVTAIQIIAGLAVPWPGTSRAGAAALGAVYFVFALLAIPAIVAHPLVYNGYGNFFEQLSLAAGAAILYACSDRIATARMARLARIGYYTFGICVVSFALEQFFYLPQTASFVPRWIPPGQMFWAIATTGAFALAALALLTGIVARFAAQLTTAMIVGFALLTWLPALLANPHRFENWSEGAETLGIAASAWVVVDFLGRRLDSAKPERIQAN